MRYQPGPPPADVGIMRYVINELYKIAKVFAAPETEEVLFTIRHAEPAKLAEGLIVYADGTDWNPGAGRGLYEYKDAAWSKL